eukprot:jgi/Mesvir1/24066/Mv10791-RA.1
MSTLSFCSPFSQTLGSFQSFPKGNRKTTPVVSCSCPPPSDKERDPLEPPASRRAVVGHAAISAAAAFLCSGLTNAAAEASPSALLPPSGGSGAIASSTSAARHLMVLVGGMTAGVGMFLAPQLSETLRRVKGASSTDVVAVRMGLEFPILACEDRSTEQSRPPSDSDLTAGADIIARGDIRAGSPPSPTGEDNRDPDGSSGGAPESKSARPDGLPPPPPAGSSSLDQDPLARIHVSIDKLERRAAEVHAVRELLGSARSEGGGWHVPKAKLADAAMRVAELGALVKKVGHDAHSLPALPPKRILETGLWTPEEIAAVDPEIYQEFLEQLTAVEILRVQVAAERAELEALEVEALKAEALKADAVATERPLLGLNGAPVGAGPGAEKMGVAQGPIVGQAEQ